MSISKSLRNRLIGLLVIVSLIMIIVPAMMDPRQVYVQDEDAIAVNDQGAILDKNGQLVSPAEHDYTDLLAPEDDTLSSTGNVPTIPVTNNNNAPLITGNSPQGQEELEVPDDNMFGPAPTIIDAKPLNSQKDQSLYSSSQTQEVLPSAHNASPSPKKSETPVANASKQNTAQNKPAVSAPKSANTSSVKAKGDYALQVGVFSNKNNADSVLTKLKMLGYKPVTQVINVNGKSAVRIYAGFADSREAAKSLASEIQNRTGYKCNVVSH